MRNIRFTKAVLTGFRGQTRTIEFKDRLTRIVGFNGTGKTSVYVAVKWCLTGVDERDRTNYNLFDNTLDFTPENSTPVAVELYVDADGVEYVFKRQAKQRWIRPRGSAEYKKASSDEYKFYVDGLELSATEYKNRVVGVFGMETDKLKLCMDVLYYQMLDWKELRKHFADIAGEVTSADLKGDYSDIQEYIDKYNYESAKTYLSQQINPLKKQSKEIDASIKAQRGLLPDLSEVAGAQKKIEENKKRIEEINREILGLEEANKPFVAKREAESVEIEALKSEYRDKEREYKDRYRDNMAELERELYDANRHNNGVEAQKKRNEQAIARHNTDIQLCKEDLKDATEEYNILKKQNIAIKERQFTDTVCHACGQELPADRIAELRKKFFEDNDKERAPIVERGKKVAARKKELELRLERLQSEEVIVTDSSEALIDTDEIKNRIERCHDDLIPFEQTPGAKVLLAHIEEKKSALTVVPEVNSAELQEESRTLIADIESLSRITARKEAYDSGIEKIRQYETDKKNVGIELALWEGRLAKLIEREREWADVIRDRANNHLEYSHVEMIEISKAGEKVDTCTLSIDGVDRGVTNHANKTIVGIDISNSICKRYGVNVPLFIDDFEHFTSNLEIAGERQIVTLSADKHYSELTIL